jgi:signal transduction histidine kinase
MSSLGQLVAGVAHEINNPVSFIYGNIKPAQEYIADLLQLVELYQTEYPQPTAKIQSQIELIDLDFLMEDVPKILDSMKVGAERIREIVLSLRNFSRMDEAQIKNVCIHDGIDSTLRLLQNRLKAKPEHPEILVVKNYGQLPLVECYAGQLNQVFMNLLTNAIDAVEERDKKRSLTDIKANPSQIEITTKLVDSGRIAITFKDNGPGMSPEIQARIFDPFFTTKPVGKGTGLGLAISYQVVVEKHLGSLCCHSVPGEGTNFTVEIPIKQKPEKP